MVDGAEGTSREELLQRLALLAQTVRQLSLFPLSEALPFHRPLKQPLRFGERLLGLMALLFR
jgi:hypothetical protein